jgi:hypothetical protein
VSSMGSVGDAYDKAAAVSFVATLKCEQLHRYSWPRRLDAELAMFDYVETFYNRRRRHSTVGQVSPMVYEERNWSRIAVNIYADARACGQTKKEAMRTVKRNLSNVVSTAGCATSTLLR